MTFLTRSKAIAALPWGALLLALILPGDNDSVSTMPAGVLRDVPARRSHPALLDAAPLDEAAARGYAKALVSCTADHAAALMTHDGAGWHQEAAWPYPPVRGRWQHILAWEPLCRTP